MVVHPENFLNPDSITAAMEGQILHMGSHFMQALMLIVGLRVLSLEVHMHVCHMFNSSL
jgi:hypothetical protein